MPNKRGRPALKNPRRRQVNVRVNPEEERLLNKMRAPGESTSGVVRRLLREASSQDPCYPSPAKG